MSQQTSQEKNSLKQRETATITFIGSICGVSALGCPAGYAAAKSALEAYARNTIIMNAMKNAKRDAYQHLEIKLMNARLEHA